MIITRFRSTTLDYSSSPDRPLGRRHADGLTTMTLSHTWRPRTAISPRHRCHAHETRPYLAPFDELANPRLLADLARLAESRGWDGLFLWDRITYPPRDRPVADPWVALGAIATVTNTLRIGAIDYSALAQARSEGRARDGHAGPPRQWASHNGRRARQHRRPRAVRGGVDARERGRLLDEGLEQLSGFWKGRFRPRPVQRPRIPVWVAANWPNRRPPAAFGVLQCSLRLREERTVACSSTRRRARRSQPQQRGSRGWRGNGRSARERDSQLVPGPAGGGTPHTRVPCGRPRLGSPQPPQCFAEPTQRLRRLLAIDRGAKRVACRDPVPRLQGFVPDRERIFARLLHGAML